MFFTHAKFSKNHGHNIIRLFDVSPNFTVKVIKRSSIISNKLSIPHLHDELSNDATLRILEN